MISFQESIQTIESSLDFNVPFSIRTSAYFGRSSGETIDVRRSGASETLARFIYSKFHARERECLPRTGKVDIIRFLRGKFGSSQTTPEGVGVYRPRFSVNRSPGFVHVFGSQGWKQGTGAIGRYYLTAPDAVQRVEQFAEVVEILEEKRLYFQAKTSWNPSVVRTDDSVFYFSSKEDFEEARSVLESLPLPQAEGDELLPCSLFVIPISPAVGMAIEKNRSKNDGLSFGLERSTVCAEFIVEKCKQSGDLAVDDFLRAWNCPLTLEGFEKG